MSSPADYASRIARAGLEIGAIKLRPDDPFQWASGYRMPIYNDNRMFLFRPHHRSLIADGFHAILVESVEQRRTIPVGVIAGTSTAGIAPGVLLAERLHTGFIYVRDKPKDHGLRNQIEGIGAEKDLEGRKVLLIEDLISTGESSARAVQAIRNANGECGHCFSIFNYGLDKAVEAFSSLNPPCQVSSLLTYDVLLQVAKDVGYLAPDQVRVLEEWRADPFGWGEKHGFPPMKKEGGK